MSLQNHVNWKALAQIPSWFSSYDNPPIMVSINDRYYIIIGTQLEEAKYALYDSIQDILKSVQYKMSQLWKPFRPKDFIKCVYHANNQSIYIFNMTQERLARIDTTTNIMTVVSDQFETSYEALMTSMDNVIHILDLKETNPNHYIFNPEASTITKYSAAQSKLKLVSHAIAFQSQKWIVAWDDNSMHKYVTKQQKWRKYAKIQGFNQYIWSSASVVTKDENKIIFFTPHDNNEVMIFDLKDLSTAILTLKPPSKGLFIAATMVFSKDRDALMTSGFIKQCYKQPKFKDIMALPASITTLIGKWVTIEHVHLILQEQDFNYKHWKINVDDIM